MWTTSGQPYHYKNFIQIMDPSAGLMNQLLAGSNSNSVWNLTTAQMGMLVPHIAIYKIVRWKTERDFILMTLLSIDSITRETGRGRGEDVGLVSFSWADMGTNPDNTGLSFEASLKLKFQSFDGVFKTRSGELNLQISWSLRALLEKTKKKLQTKSAVHGDT